MKRKRKHETYRLLALLLLINSSVCISGGYLIVANVLSHPVMKMGDMLGLWTAAFDTLFTEGIITQVVISVSSTTMVWIDLCHNYIPASFGARCLSATLNLLLTYS